MAVTSEREGAVAETPSATVRRRPWLALVVAALCFVPYAGLVLPYYANDLGDLPPGETLVAQDLSAMWPYDTDLGGPIAFIMVVGMPLAPFVAVAVAMWSGFSLWDAWRTMTRSEIVLYAAAAVVAVGSVAWLATPLAGELLIWFLD